MGSERVVDAARDLGVEVELIERPAAESLEQAAELLGIAPSSVVKSLVVGRSDGTFLFALVPGDRQIAWAKLRAAVGVNKLRLPSAEEALAATGYERGTITPLGSVPSWPVFADERISGRIAMGAGAHGVSAFLDADALLPALGATVADITS